MRPQPVEPGSYDVSFRSALREWTVHVTLTYDWLNLKTFVMHVPQSRSKAVMEAVLRANGRLSLAKFSLAEEASLCLELEYRAEHVDDETAQKLIHAFVRAAEREYPHLVRASGDDAALEALEAAFNRS